MHVPLSREVQVLASQVHAEASAEMFPVLDPAEETAVETAAEEVD
jgi:hypothetical protein